MNQEAFLSGVTVHAAVEAKAVNAIRMLSAEGVQAANSGHPGMPMGMAQAAYTLWSRYLRFNPANPAWANRDRFVLSTGHGSMLLYSLLHLTGYDLSLDELRNFRQWGSKTPGHPEFGDLTPGVETTTGPLGQGLTNGVGMAIAERWLATRFNRPGFDIVDHYTYAIVGDGDLMEGISSEAASLAGHLSLGKLIYLYDNNSITIDGTTDISFTEKWAQRFDAYGWHVQEVDALDPAAIGSSHRRGQGRPAAEHHRLQEHHRLRQPQQGRTPPRSTVSRWALKSWRQPRRTWAGPRSPASSCPTMYATSSPMP